jgi:SWI/SNF-related matrix-associated actin-dependent regulator 1 of chromatin subfamily A
MSRTHPYCLTPDDARLLVDVPGLRPIQAGSGTRFQAHLSHLPLLPHSLDAARALMRTGEAPDVEYLARLGIKLRPTQFTAIDFLTSRPGALLADDMRLGKTLSCLLSHDSSTGPLVVICPLMVRAVFLGWLRKLYRPDQIFVMTSRTYERTDAPVVIGHYDVLPFWQSNRPIGTLIFDEAHVLTNRNTRRTQAALLLAAQAQRVICATGTPIWNRPINFWPILTLLAPGAWGDYHTFARRYGDPQETGFGTVYNGVSNEAELTARLSAVMLRRRWVDVADDVPAVHRGVIIADLTLPERNKLDLIAAELLGDGTKATTAGRFAAYRRAVSTVKRRVVLAEMTKARTNGHPLVVWTWHVDLARKLAEAAEAPAFLITGETPAAAREQILAAWRAEPAAPLIVSMAVAQVGLDFSHARDALFAEIDYTPAMLAQAEMRTFAPTRSMAVTYVVADHVVDRRVVLALTRKLAAASPLGVAAARETINVLDEALHGPADPPDLDRLMTDLLESA